ncbi:MAG: L-2-amino-thiazoline-4-carboxylic acid hydrolase [Deltaproteobacteria bacterium]|nr:L-2-amino-thiazoline-4-carboxylic acid hydrolase [Candidatus Zymogenaceae bacterium]
MDDERKQQLQATVEGLWGVMKDFGKTGEEAIPAEEAAEERRALARRIGRLYLAFARVLIKHLGEDEARSAIMEAMRDYSMQCAEARKAGMMDLPQRGIHKTSEIVGEGGARRLVSTGCGIAQEFRRQDEEKLGALYCYVDPCSFMFTIPNIKLYHTKMEPLGDDCCEFDLGIASDDEMAAVTEPGRDYGFVDPIIEERAQGDLLKHKK